MWNFLLSNNYDGVENTVDWNAVYKSVFSATIETKLRSFQIKLNLRAIVTNITLYGFGIKDTENCDFCKQFPETLMHIFCECPCVKLYWENVSAYICGVLKKNFVISDFDKVFGFQNSTPNFDCNINLLNCLLLCARFVIFRCKYGNRLPSVFEFLQFVKTVKYCESKIAVRREKTGIFRSKWQCC